MAASSYIIAFVAAIAAGFINAIAGGGTLVTFPVLVALGIPPIAANLTNTIALCPGYFSGVFVQRLDFTSQKQRLWKLLPVCIMGGIGGGLLLLMTNENSFRKLIPFLILIATILIAIQQPLRKKINDMNKNQNPETTNFKWVLILTFFASIYGGYFGAGLGVILMAVLGLFIHESLNKLNVLKQSISFAINISAAIFFSFSGKAIWDIALVMAFGAVIGGSIGGKLSGFIKQEILRWIIISIGMIVTIIYFVMI